LSKPQRIAGGGGKQTYNSISPSKKGWTGKHIAGSHKQTIGRE